MSNRTGVREVRPGKRLVHDDLRGDRRPVVVTELTPFDQLDAERAEELWRHASNTDFSPGCRPPSVDRQRVETDLGVEQRAAGGRDGADAWQSSQLTRDLAIKAL